MEHLKRPGVAAPIANKSSNTKQNSRKRKIKLKLSPELLNRLKQRTMRIIAETPETPVPPTVAGTLAAPLVRPAVVVPPLLAHQSVASAQPPVDSTVQVLTHTVLQQDEIYYAELAHIFRLREQGIDATVKMPFIKKHLQISHSTIYREIARGNLSRPIKVGHASVWRFSQVEAYRLGTSNRTEGSEELASATKKSMPNVGHASNAISSQRPLAQPKLESKLSSTFATSKSNDSVHFKGGRAGDGTS